MNQAIEWNTLQKSNYIYSDLEVRTQIVGFTEV